ncbi:MAG: SprB repeat-containing protein, partial [Bacteroidota bacterium]|nr:SprB repeat-containing protein [Bacteroidota bacterium]
MAPIIRVNLKDLSAPFSSLRFSRITLIASLVLLVMHFDASSQNCNTCAAVTSFTVDLSSKPDTSWTVNSTRSGQCCTGSGSDKCIVFYVTVNPAATEIRFVYRNGSANNGAYQINCTGPAVSPGTPLCLSGLTTFCITYCNPGNSSDNYTITTSSGFAAGPDFTLRSGCSDTLTVTGLVESSLNWTSVYPGIAGAYNSYLSCVAGCDSTLITPGVGAPAYVDYKVCGARTGCSLGSYCDTQRVYMSPVMTGNITPANPIICGGGPNQTLTANVTGGSPPYSYLWNTGAATSSLSAGPGTYTVTVTDQASACSPVITSVTVASASAATANAGSDSSVCSGLTHTLSGAFGGSAVSCSWSTSGTGTFNNNTLTNATYTPSAADILAGSVTLTITAVGSCPGVTDAMVLTISPAATANAGSDATICSGSTHTLSGSRGGSSSSSSWSTSGTGTFNNVTLLNAIYTPSVADNTAGSVTLTLTTDDPAGTCVAGSDVMVLTINPIAISNAGLDTSVCAGSTYTLSGSIGGGATTSTWTTSGTGTFSNSSSVTATYTPSPSDIIAGIVTLTLTTNDPAGPCNAVNDAMVLNINAVSSVNAGSDATICAGSTHTLSGAIGGSATSATWSTSGTGTFSDATSLAAIYTASPADIVSGSVSLTLTTNDPAGPCPASNDLMVLTINPVATVNAGANDTICAGSNFTLSGTRGGSATSSTWTTSGTGTFNNATLLNAIYTPSTADITAGNVTLTLTTNDPAGPCGPVNDAMLLVIQSVAITTAGSDATICSGSTHTLAGTRGGSATSSTWTTSGTGTFFDVTSITATYTPSAADITSGSVTLTITTNDPAGPCPAVNDAMVLTINQAATVNAGVDATICAGTTHTLSGVRGGSATSSTWTTSGTGTFNDATFLTAIYTPSAADITATTVTLTLTTNDPVGTCNAVSDAMVLTINSTATVSAGSDETICSGSTHTLAGTRGGSATSSTWTTSGTGT